MSPGFLSLVDVSFALAAGDDASLEAALRKAVAESVPLEVEEALLQSYLFLGFPAALRGFGAWRRVGGTATRSVSEAGDVGDWEERGVRTCGIVYGGQYPRLRANIAALHPDMERWMIVEGYGKVLSREGLGLAERELCIVALLAPQDAAPQLYAHLRGALNAGASPALVDEVVGRLEARLPAPRADVLREQWKAVRRRRPGAEARD